MKRLLATLALLSIANLTLAESPLRRVISSSVTEVKQSTSQTYFKCIGAGRAAEGLRGSWQKQLTRLQAEAPFEYIRFHGLFHDDMGVYSVSDDGEEIYNFQYIDDLYDFLLSVDIKPFVELSFTPDAMKSGEQTVFWWKGNVTPPKDMDKWARLVREFTKHITERYGAEEVKSWYFEVWNEPDHPSFFSGKLNDYLSLYHHTADAIKSVNKEYRVGGPATAGSGWIPKFVDYCTKNDVAMDFISTHTYGVYGALDEFGKKQLRLTPNPNAVVNSVGGVHKQIASLGKGDVELHYTEWNSSYSPRDLTHDTYLNAAYVLNTLRHTDDKVKSMSYWTFTDIFEESGIPTEPLHGGFGLMTMSGLRKPTYFSYLYLKQLGDEELQNSDDNSWVCRDESGNIQILAYDITLPKMGKKDFNNTVFNREREPKFKCSLFVKLDDMTNGRYSVEVYNTGYRKNDIQTVYFDLGRPKTLSQAEHKILAMHSQDSPQRLEIIEIKDGRYDLELPMLENDIFLVKLTRLD